MSVAKISGCAYMEATRGARRGNVDSRLHLGSGALGRRRLEAAVRARGRRLLVLLGGDPRTLTGLGARTCLRGGGAELGLVVQHLDLVVGLLHSHVGEHVLVGIDGDGHGGQGNLGTGGDDQ